MGQKVNPTGFRVGVFGEWTGSWFANRKDYGALAIEDSKIRSYLDKNLSKNDYSGCKIERTGDEARVILFSGKPGSVIGKKGAGIEKLRQDLVKCFKKKIEVSVKEIKTPEMSAQAVARSIASQIEGRVSFKKVMRRAGYSVVRAGAKGVKICIGGRLGGAEIARKEQFRQGSIPLHTLRAKIDYALVEAKTTYGILGIKVWICAGEY